MIQINLPEIHELIKINIIPDTRKYHPPTKQYGFQNKTIPIESGVYFIFDKNDNIIYIGHAKNIRIRIAQHAKRFDNEALKISYVLEKDYKFSILGIERLYIDLYKPKYNDKPSEIESIWDKYYSTIINSLIT